MKTAILSTTPKKVKSYYVTTTKTHAESVMREILRLDLEATLSHRRDNNTLLLVRGNKFSELTLEAIDGVAHAVALTALGKAPDECSADWNSPLI